MFIGHFGLAFGAKKLTPISLGTLFISFQFLDLVWPSLLLSGTESVIIHPEVRGSRVLEFVHFPYTHSLVMVVAWSLLFGGTYWLLKKDRTGALILGFGVLSHWILDFIVHFHDLPLTPAETSFAGLGLWASPVATNVIEAGLLGTGIFLYARSTTPKNKTGMIVPWVIAGL